MPESTQETSSLESTFLQIFLTSAATEARPRKVEAIISILYTDFNNISILFSVWKQFWSKQKIFLSVSLLCRSLCLRCLSHKTTQGRPVASPAFTEVLFYFFAISTATPSAISPSGTCRTALRFRLRRKRPLRRADQTCKGGSAPPLHTFPRVLAGDRKSTRLNSSH